MNEQDKYAEEVQRTQARLAASIREFTFYRPLGESGPVAHQVRVWRHMLHNLLAGGMTGTRIPYQEACALLNGHAVPMSHYDRSCIEQARHTAAVAHARLRVLHPYIQDDL